MTKRHPANDWEWEDYAEESFQEWFNDLYGDYSLRAEWFYGDCEVEDVKTRQSILASWLHSAYIAGWEASKYAKMEAEQVGLTE
jgi:hypothetical protein